MQSAAVRAATGVVRPGKPVTVNSGASRAIAAIRAIIGLVLVVQMPFWPLRWAALCIEGFRCGRPRKALVREGAGDVGSVVTSAPSRSSTFRLWWCVTPEWFLIHTRCGGCEQGPSAGGGTRVLVVLPTVETVGWRVGVGDCFLAKT